MDREATAEFERRRWQHLARGTLFSAIFLGVAPLATGCAIFAAWLATRSFLLELAGLFTIGLGVLAVLVGSVFLLVHITLALRGAGQPVGRVLRNAVLAGGLLVVNFPAAGAIVWAVSWVESGYEVRVINDSSVFLSGVRVQGGGIEETLGDLGPGQMAERTLRPRHRDTLVFTADKGGESLRKKAGHVDRGLDGGVEIRVSEHGFSVRTWNSD